MKKDDKVIKLFDEERLLIILIDFMLGNAFGPKSFHRYGRRNSVFPTGTFDSGAVVPGQRPAPRHLFPAGRRVAP